ncbi:hypothetical protein LDENG_00154130 [Lucifuga dentata]|nr:hypothetical protein LDENG_00154130 [Lucifuga dentata]
MYKHHLFTYTGECSHEFWNLEKELTRFIVIQGFALQKLVTSVGHVFFFFFFFGFLCRLTIFSLQLLPSGLHQVHRHLVSGLHLG